MKFKVTTSVLFIAGQKYKRGDIVDLADASMFGSKLDPVPEVAAPVEKPKPKAVKKPRAKKS